MAEAVTITSELHPDPLEDTRAEAPHAREQSSARFIAIYIFAQMAAYIGIMTPVVITIALKTAQIAAPETKAVQLGLVLGVGALGALLGAPLWGAISDRTTWRLGKRKPWMIVGALSLLAGLCVMAAAANMMVLGIGWLICQVGSNANQATLNAVMADVIPDRLRGRVSSLLGLCVPLSIGIGTFLTQFTTGNAFLMFVVPWLFIPIAVGLMVAVFQDEPAKLAPARGTRDRLPIAVWFRPFLHANYSWAFVSRFMVFFGGAFLGTYQVYVLTDRLHVGSDKIAQFVFFSTAVTTGVAMTVSIVSGWLSDRLGRRKPFVGGAAIVMGVGLLMIGRAESYPAFLTAAAITSLGQGLYYAIDVALVVSVLPNRQDAAKDMGVFQIANSAPQMLAPLIAPLFLGIGATAGGNYPAVFIAAAVFALLGGLAIVPIKSCR